MTIWVVEIKERGRWKPIIDDSDFRSEEDADEICVKFSLQFSLEKFRVMQYRRVSKTNKGEY